MFDDINYLSGAQKVTFFQMKCMLSDYQIHAFSLTKPKKELDCKGIPILGEEIWENGELFSKRWTEVFLSKKYSIRKKISRFWYAVFRQLGKGETYFEQRFFPKLKKIWEGYDCVIVVSEASKLRGMVSRLTHPKKIQWIHTDYLLWSTFSDWTKNITKQDAMVYCRFDRVVLLSESSRQGFLQKFPQLKEKAVVIPNLIDGETILKKAEEPFFLKWEEGLVHFLTIGRLEKEKGYDRILDLCGKLQKEGYSFCWYLVGEGKLKEHLKKRIKTERLKKRVKLIGELENPYPLMKRCDWLVLLSEYEGTPVTIDEAMVLGVPVMTRKVGGIAKQLERGKGIYRFITSDRDLLECYKINRTKKEKPFDYVEWNQNILYQIKELLG